MLGKKFASVCILALTFSFFTVYAHQQSTDPGPTIIEGDIANMNDYQTWQIGYDCYTWVLTDSASDSQGNTMLSADVTLEKRLHYDGNWVYNATGGTSTASVSAAATVSGFATRGDYYVKAKARGLLWYRSERLSDSYNNGVSKSVPKSAVRLSGSPTLSGVHLWGKAEVDNQFGDVEVIFEWL